MIGFNSLGKMGRLGNQMFQFAALKGIARNRGFEYCIPKSNYKNEWTDHQLLIPFKLSCTTSLNLQEIDYRRPTVIESDFTFDEKLFNKCPDWVNLQGYFQSEKYFKHIKDEILKDFEFNDDIFKPCKNMISSYKNPVSLHIRRSDYITDPNHTVLSLSYYERAICEFDSDFPVFIFSDDFEWCKKQKIFDSDRFLISENNSSYVDLCLMTLCSGHIIANSSFSWWGAWLSKSKKVIAPSGWFDGSNNQHIDTKDLIPDEWMVI